MSNNLPNELDEVRHVRHIDIELATGFDAALLALTTILPKRLFRDRVAREIWNQQGRPTAATLEREPITFKLRCAADPNLYEVWVNTEGRAYARHFVKRA